MSAARYALLRRVGLALVALLSTAAKAEDVVTRTFDASAVRKLSLSNGVGKVRIKGGDARQATVVAKKLKFDQGCRLDIELKGSELVVTNKEPESLLGGKQCQVEMTVDVPRQTQLDLHVGAGDVDIEGLKANVDYKLGSGDLEIRDAEIATLDGKSGSGDVTIAGVVTEAELKLGAGNADITYTRAVPTGRLDVKVGTGSATIKVPKDAKIRSTFKAGMGSLTNELGDAPDARFTISGSAGAGDMTIRRI